MSFVRFVVTAYFLVDSATTVGAGKFAQAAKTLTYSNTEFTEFGEFFNQELVYSAPEPVLSGVEGRLRGATPSPASHESLKSHYFFRLSNLNLLALQAISTRLPSGSRKLMERLPATSKISGPLTIGIFRRFSTGQSSSTSSFVPT